MAITFLGSIQVRLVLGGIAAPAFPVTPLCTTVEAPILKVSAEHAIF